MLTSDDIRALLVRLDGESADAIESQELDCKEWIHSERKASEKMLRETVVCLANQRGGVILLGVADRKRTRAEAFVGVSTSLDPAALRSVIYDGTEPHIEVEIDELLEPEGRLLVIHVPLVRPRPVTTSDGTAKIRVGKECKPLTGPQITLLSWVDSDPVVGGAGPAPTPALQPETIEQRVARLEREDEEESARLVFLATNGRALAAKEAVVLLEHLTELGSKIGATAERVDEHCQGCFQKSNFTLCVGWYTGRYINVMTDDRLIVTLWGGLWRLRPAVLTHREPPKVSETPYTFDVAPNTHQPLWRSERSNVPPLSTRALAEQVINELLDQIEKVRKHRR